MTNKNPYEIRADVLALAKDYMDAQVQMNIEYVKKMQALGKASLEDHVNAYQPYSFDDLMKKAKDMYRFVSETS